MIRQILYSTASQSRVSRPQMASRNVILGSRTNWLDKWDIKGLLSLQ